MGFLGDLRYFGPHLGWRRGLRLAAAKAAKWDRKRRTAAALRAAESETAFFARLGLPADPERRRMALRESWAALAASPILKPFPDAVEFHRFADAGADPRSLAEAVLSGRQILFGQRLEVGWPPRWDWRWQGTGNASAFAGDVRSTWELQRLQGILPLAAAARPGAADRERFARAYLDAVLDFGDAHPAPPGPAWASALEVGLRLVALAQGLPQVVDTRDFADRHSQVLRLLDRHARWLAADLSLDKVVPGNHLLGELAGLLVAGHLVPSARASWWGSLPVRSLLEAEILRQLHPDGVSVEQSLPYEGFVLEFLIAAGEAARLGGEPLKEPARARLDASVRHLEAAIGPDGELPRIGDTDSGRGAWFGAPDPHRPEISLARARAHLGWADEGKPTEDARVRCLRTRGGAELRWYRAGGHGVIRTPQGDHLYLRGGNFGWGVPGPASHSHADWLAPVLWIEGEPLLIDPGVYGYGVEPALRDADRVWFAHGGFRPGPDRGPRPAGRFRWSDWSAQAALEAGGDDENLKFLGRVEWSGGKGALLWHRSIRYNELQRGWFLHDRREGSVGDPAEWAFRWAPGVKVAEAGVPGRYRLDLPSGRRRLLCFETPGSARVEPGWAAPAYGSRVEAPVLVWQSRAGSPEARTTILPA